MSKKLFAAVLCLAVISLLFAGCNSGGAGSSAAPESSAAPSSEVQSSSAPASEPEPSSATPKGKIILSTTTSTEDSGLLGYILPVFTAETGWEVDTIAVGTGAALQMGRDGEADVLLVHSRPDEDKFVEEGFAEKRYDVMYNDYVVVGPKDGMIEHNADIKLTFETIAAQGFPFVSRGDDSGTHKKELGIWKSLDIDPESNSGYVSAGQGMGATLGMTAEMKAYTLSDRATWLSFADKGDLIIVCEKVPELLNPYGVIPVSASVSDKINTEGGQAFADWITSKPAQDLIATFGLEEYGEPLFIPDAK